MPHTQLIEREPAHGRVAARIEPLAGGQVACDVRQGIVLIVGLDDLAEETHGHAQPGIPRQNDPAALGDRVERLRRQVGLEEAHFRSDGPGSQLAVQAQILSTGRVHEIVARVADDRAGERGEEDVGKDPVHEALILRCHALIEHVGALHLVAAADAHGARQTSREFRADATPREVEARSDLLFERRRHTKIGAAEDARLAKLTDHPVFRKAEAARFGQHGRLIGEDQRIRGVQGGAGEEVHRAVPPEQVPPADLEGGAWRKLDLVGRHVGLIGAPHHPFPHLEPAAIPERREGGLLDRDQDIPMRAVAVPQLGNPHPAEETQRNQPALALADGRGPERASAFELELTLDRVGLRPHVADDEDVLDEHLRSLVDGEHDPSPGAVWTQAGVAVDGDVRIPEVGIRELNGVAVGGQPRGHVRLPRLQAEPLAQPSVRHVFVAADLDRAHDRPGVLGDLDLDGDGHVGGARGHQCLRGRLHLHGGKPLAMVHVFDRRQIRRQAGRRERLALPEAQPLHQRGRGEVNVAGQLDARDAVEGTTLHGERHEELAVHFFTLVRRRRIPIPLRAEVLFDPVRRVLQQVLVGRSISFDRHELIATFGRQRIALEDHPHQRADGDGDRQVDRAVIVGEGGRDARPRPVIAATPAAVEKPVESGAQGFPFVRGPFDEVEAAEQFCGGHTGRALNVHGADVGALARFDPEEHR